jgi:hypothetical protein
MAIGRFPGEYGEGSGLGPRNRGQRRRVRSAAPGPSPAPPRSGQKRPLFIIHTPPLHILEMRIRILSSQCKKFENL